MTTSDAILTAVRQVSDGPTLLVILAAAVYGIFVGAIPGLTATMAVALLVPLTYFLSDVQAIAAIVTTVTCSIFAGDIPATLVRIPGTPASAAYAADGYALTRRGRHRDPLLVSLVFSVIGGLLGTLVLIVAAPQLARVATSFTSYEEFWLYLLGLTCAAIVSHDSRLKGLLALLTGLLLSTVGLGTDYSVPRLTFGSDELITGVNFIPAMIGLFGISEILRNVLVLRAEERGEGISAGTGATAASAAPSLRIVPFVVRRSLGLLRSSSIGAFVGMLPGAGADIAAWIAYAVSKRFSRRPQEYGNGSLEGIGDATGANNAALGGAWIPALVFGIPGDSVTAIALGVLMMKNITPGPAIFDTTDRADQAVLAFAIYATFVIANLMLIPVGLAAIRIGSLLVRVPRRVLLPVIVLFCILGSYAMNASYFDVWVMLALGVLGFVYEANRVPLGPVVLGIILGGELEHRFIQCITKEATLQAFLGSTISIVLAAACAALWAAPALAAVWRRRRGSSLN